VANWHPFIVQVPGKDLLEPVRNVLETLVIFLDVLKAILDTVKVFLVDFGNPIKALVEALIKLIEELFLSLKTSGVYAYFDVPDPTSDPNFNKYSGGFKAFTERFKGSLFDAQDFNRPQPRQGSTQSGFVILLVDASSPYALLARIKQLLRFFGREFTSPRYEPPVNFKALPVGTKGDPIFAVPKIFTDGPIKAVQLQWSLPTSMGTPDPGFTDLVTRAAAEFVPPNFLIERSTINPASKKIDISELSDPSSTGIVQITQESPLSVGTSRKPAMRTTLLRDEYGDSVVKFQKYTVIDQLSVTGLMGQLGKFRYIDTDVTPNTTYYYRVRAFSGDLKVSGDQLAFPTQDQLTFSIESAAKVMKWPSTVASESVVMGKASGIMPATVPFSINPATFDVIGDLVKLFETAFSLDFHLELDPKSLFDSNGIPYGGTSPIQIGRGSLMNLASSLAMFESLRTVGDLSRAPTINEAFQPDPITDLYPERPWENSSVQKQAARLANAVASSLLQAGGEALNGFRSIMQNSLPAGPISTGGTLSGANTLEAVVKGFTTVSDVPSENLKASETFVKGYYDASLRLNVLAGIQYIKTYSLGGIPVDWISVVPLRDIVPWSGQLIYDLLAKINALLDAFNGTMAELTAFIDLLERKIATLERFLEFLINILNFIESLDMGAYVLSVPELNGTANSWVQAIDTAGGTKPPSGPGGYSAGVALGYVAPDITAFKTAFSLIFGS
jgi:hypothetical protein